MPRTWSDQPEEVDQKKVLAGLHLNGRHVEVRADLDQRHREFYVTVGNLFGSQTVYCTDVTSMFAFLQMANDVAWGKVRPLPPGVRLLPNAGETTPIPPVEREVP